MLSEASRMNLLTPEGGSEYGVIPLWNRLSPTRHHGWRRKAAIGCLLQKAWARWA